MDDLRTRLDALEHQTTTLTHHAHHVTRQLRWWRGVACSLLVLGSLMGIVPTDAGEEQGLAQRVAALETLLTHFTREGNEVFITGANLHLVNGQGATTTTNGLGNLIVGYNEPRDEGDIRSGSHNVVVGRYHNFSRFGGLVVGQGNTISGDFASVSGGNANEASGQYAWVSGGDGNRASGDFSSAIGGSENEASGISSSVTGGGFNRASGQHAWVSGGGGNRASGGFSSVSGGYLNTASGGSSSVSGGRNRTAAGEFDWVAGPLFADE